MASDNETGGGLPDHGQNSLTLGLSMLTGAGVIAMGTAAAIGVIDGINANGEIISTLFWLGAGAFVVGAIAWGGVVRPWENFDDINQPMYHGHHHDKHADDEPQLLEDGSEDVPALPEQAKH